MAADDDSRSGIGTLREAFGALRGSVETFQKNWEIQDGRASEGRKFLFEKMEGVSREVQNVGRDLQGLSHRVDSVTTDVAEMKPAVVDWVRSKDKATGVRSALGYVWKGLWGIGGAAVMAGAWLIEHFTRVLPH